MVCQLHSSSRTQNSISILPVCCPYYDILTLSSRETFWINISFHPDWLRRSHFIFIRLTHTLSWMVWTVWYTLDFSRWRIFLALCCGKQSDAQREKREREAHRTLSVGSVWDLGPWGPLDGSRWMGALERWPNSLRTGYEGKGMLLLCVWPPDPLSNVCLGSFETQHIYLQRSEERGWSGCQNKVIVLLTASSAVEGQLWQAHNVAASASRG